MSVRRALLLVVALVPAARAEQELRPGGCGGVLSISSPILTPAVGCLEVSRASCQGSFLTIENRCGRDLTLGSLKAPYDPKKPGLEPVELYKDAAGRADARLQRGAASNDYEPASDEALSVEGRVGEQAFTLAYVKRGAREPLGPRGLRRARFGAEQVKALIGPGASGETAAQLFYHSFKADRDPALAAPVWLDRALKDLEARAVLTDPDEGPISEAQAWRAPAATLYEFFEVLRKTLPMEPPRAAVSPAALYEELDQARLRHAAAVDRLRDPLFARSLEGRGRAVRAVFLRVGPEMKRLQDAAASGNESGFIDAALKVGALSGDALRALR